MRTLTFPPIMFEAIRRGTKTVARFPAPPRSTMYDLGTEGEIVRAINGLHQSEFVNIRIKHVKRGLFGDVCLNFELMLDGFVHGTTHSDFVDAYGYYYPDNPPTGIDPIWRIEFEVVDSPEVK